MLALCCAFVVVFLRAAARVLALPFLNPPPGVQWPQLSPLFPPSSADECGPRGLGKWGDCTRGVGGFLFGGRVGGREERRRRPGRDGRTTKKGGGLGSSMSRSLSGGCVVGVCVLCVRLCMCACAPTLGDLLLGGTPPALGARAPMKKKKPPGVRPGRSSSGEGGEREKRRSLWVLVVEELETEKGSPFLETEKVGVSLFFLFSWRVRQMFLFFGLVGGGGGREGKSGHTRARAIAPLPRLSNARVGGGGDGLRAHSMISFDRDGEGEKRGRRTGFCVGLENDPGFFFSGRVFSPK
jgi:hypothetical protein